MPLTPKGLTHRWLSLLLSVSLSGFSACALAQAEDSEDIGRGRFVDALAELATGQGPRYEELRGQLDDYPLALYLDFEALSARLHDLRPDEANAFLRRAKDSPLHNRFLAAYLEHKGHDRRWREFLAVVDEAPRDTRLQCYYYRALRSTGSVDAAWAGAESLWNVGHSQDEACDPLFERWIADGGGPDDDLAWSRALKAFDERSPHLIRYVKRFSQPDTRALLDELLSVYRQPDRLVRDSHPASTAHAQLLTVGIRRLARVNPEKGRQALEQAAQQPFTDQQREAMEVLIARHSLFAQSAAPEPWLVETLGRLRDDELSGIYLRNQIAEGHWSALLYALDWLTESAAARDVWRYWRARALEQTGRTDEARSTLRALATERSYHGFLAAEALGLPYSLNAVDQESVALPVDAGLARVRELMALDRLDDARLEWRWLLGRHNREGLLALAEHALTQEWPNFAIDAANTAKAWDRIDLRFPLAFSDTFDAMAIEQGVEAAELMAIARRESALYPLAQSRVGARGLMQVMPSTGRQVARKAGLNWRGAALYDVDYNLAIGSRYYRQLLERFDGHPAKALAGYNAGPNRVERWLQRDLPMDQWIDSLPFRETREYVRAVLAYTVIYRERAGRRGTILSAQNWTLSNYGKQQ